ncbi:unnamed protein product, partial [marine sediment metagenome]
EKKGIVIDGTEKVGFAITSALKVPLLQKVSQPGN